MSHLPAMLRTVVLTRPAHRNQVLAQGLQKAGITSLSLPALALTPFLSHIPPAHEPFGYDLVVFVSGAAASHYLTPLWQAKGYPWPAETRIGTVGVSTRAIIEQVFAAHGISSSGLAWRHPPLSEPNHDSERLWQCLAPDLPALKKVLIVRGATGRDWLKEQLLAAGIQVDVLSVYERRPQPWSTEQVAQLEQASQHGLVFLVTSSESAQAIFANLEHFSMLSLWQKSIFVVIHERIEKQVQSLYASAGFKSQAVVKRCVPTSESMLSALSRAALCA